MFDTSFLFGLRRCTEGARLQGLVVNFAVSHSLMWVTHTEVMCHCMGLGTWVHKTGV